MEAAAQQRGPERRLHLRETPATVRWGRSVNTTKQTLTPPITPPSSPYPTHPTPFTLHRYTPCTSPPSLSSTFHSPHLIDSALLSLTHLTVLPTHLYLHANHPNVIPTFNPFPTVTAKPYTPTTPHLPRSARRRWALLHARARANCRSFTPTIVWWGRSVRD